MATLGGSNQHQFRGKLGRVVYYVLKGKLVARGIGERTSPPSLLELAGYLAVKLVCAFLRPLKPFINIGYAHLAKANNTSPHNEAFAYHRKNVIIGTYPDLDLNYAKVILTQGNMPLPPHPTVKVTAEGLTFRWDQEPEVFGAHWTDQVMLAAYIPALNHAVYFTSGARRNQGVEHLPLEGIERGFHVETYLSFISDDGTRMATSLYMGRLLW